MAGETVNVRLNRIIADPHSPPKTFNKVLWTRVGPEVVMEFAHYDLTDFRSALHKAESDPSKVLDLTVFIADRYAMTGHTVLELLRAASQMARNLVKEKVLTQDIVDDAMESRHE